MNSKCSRSAGEKSKRAWHPILVCTVIVKLPRVEFDASLAFPINISEPQTSGSPVGLMLGARSSWFSEELGCCIPCGLQMVNFTACEAIQQAIAVIKSAVHESSDELPWYSKCQSSDNYTK